MTPIRMNFVIMGLYTAKTGHFWPVLTGFGLFWEVFRLKLPFRAGIPRTYHLQRGSEALLTDGIPR